MGLAETAQLAVRIGLDDKLSPGLAKTSRNLGNFEKGLGRTAKGVGQVSKGLLTAGAIAAGVAATGLTLAAKKAIEMDDAFAAVAKTVENASSGELQALNDQLHALATRIPVKYTDLAAIAAEAGALGVPTKSVAKFTEVVARLSASTQGLSVEAAAEAFGKFRNILHITDAQLTNTASSLIALGNAGASSESDIIEVAKRFAAAGAQAKLSAADVLGFSSAITSLGVEPEAAGSSLSRLFNNITKYIGTGDSKIKAFAKTAGVSVKAFSTLFAHDAKGAVLDFLKGLSGLDRFQASKVLKDAGITNVRDINAVLLLSQNYKELARQLGVSEDAFKKNTALTDVSTKRFDTLQNKIKVLAQNFQEAGYQIATGFLPALGRTVDKFTAFLQDPKNREFLHGLGRDLGKALDRVDFDKLLRLGQGLVKALDPALQLVLKLGDLIASLPPELVGAGGTLLIANKVSGGAISSGIGNIIGGLGETFARTLLSQVPLFGRAFVQPVFVTNLGGLGGGGGIGGAAGAVEGAAGGIAPAVAPLGIGAFLGVAGAGGAAFGIVSGIEQAVTDGLAKAFGGSQGDAFKALSDRARNSSALGSVGDFVRDPSAAIGKTADAINQLTSFLSQPHPDFLGDLGNLLNAQYHPSTGATSRDMDKNLDLGGPVSRDMDKNLQSAASVLKNLQSIGIQLSPSLSSLRERLASIIAREAAATRTHDGAWLAKLQAKEAEVRSAIERKRLSTSVHVNVTNSVSISAINNTQKVHKAFTSMGVIVGAR